MEQSMHRGEYHGHHHESGKNSGGHDGGHGGHHEHGGNHHAHMVADFRRRFWVCLGLTVPVVVLSPMIREWLGILDSFAFTGDVEILLVLSAVVYVYGGWPFLKGMIDEFREKRPGMMTLVAMAISVAFFYSAAVVVGLSGKMFFWETVTLIDLMLLGHWIEMRSVMGAGRALEELVKLMPSEAHRITEDGSEEDVPVADLVQGDRVALRPGEKVPADGTITEGRTSMNESMLTGESRPVEKGDGDQVVAGAVNGTGSIVFQVTKTGEDSYLSQVVKLVREAQSSRSRAQDLANRAAFILTVVAVVAGIITFVVWLSFVGRDFSFALERMVTVMVIACPHALGLAVPLVVAVSTSLSATNGLLIRNRAAFESARNLDTIVFDKTGTLTKGEFGVTDILVMEEGVGEDDILRLAASVELHSEHPIAAGVISTAREKDLDIPRSTDFESITGQGVVATVDGAEVRVLSPRGLKEAGISRQSDKLEELGRQGKTVVYVLKDGTLLGALALADVVRKESGEAVKMLHEMGVNVVMLTGDKKEVADYVGSELNLDRVIAEVMPDQKSNEIKKLQGEGKKVAMTGDGVNDAPALANADIGIAIGAGTDVAVETADIVLVRSDPRDVVKILGLSRATYSKMKQNLWYAAGYNVVAIPLAAGVLAGFGIVLSPAVGAVLMSLSTVVVAINARFLRFGTDA